MNSTFADRTALGWTPRSAVGRGVAGGLAGGMAMAMFAMLVAIGEDGFWAPARGITSVVFGDEHYGGGFAFWPVVAGMMGHMMNSAILGGLFAAVVAPAFRRASNITRLAAGAAFGLLAWVVMLVVVAGALQGSDLLADAIPAWAWIVAHLAFGMGVALPLLKWPGQGGAD